MKNLIVTGLLSAVAATSFAQSKTDVKAIDDLCGCFEVTFNYAETFTNDTQNEYKAGKLNDKAVVELSMPIEKTDKKSSNPTHPGCRWPRDQALERRLDL